MTDEELLATIAEPTSSDVRHRLALANGRAWDAHVKFLQEREVKQQAESRAKEAEAKLAASGEHCATCICGRRAPVQGEGGREGRRQVGPGTVTWEEHILAYSDYARQYGTSQSAERMAQRGGFGYWEMSGHLGREPSTWKPSR